MQIRPFFEKSETLLAVTQGFPRWWKRVIKNDRVAYITFMMVVMLV